MPSESISAMMFGSIRSVERPLPEGHLDRVDASRRRCASVSPFGCVTRAVDLVEQGGERRRDDVDDVLRGGLAGAEVGGVAHHRLGRGGVAAVLARQLGDVGGGVVDDLAAQVLREVLAVRRDRGRRADVRLRRHREHVRRLADHGAGRVGARARRG